MNRISATLVSIFIMTSACGCGQKAEQATPAQNAAAPAAEAPFSKTIDPSTAGTLKGKVTFAGEAPAPRELQMAGNPECSVLHPQGKALSEELLVSAGSLQNVFVYVKEGLEGNHFDPPAEPVTITNQGCLYVPHVAGVQVGQPLILLNNDQTLHNIHAYPKNSTPFNLGLPFQGMKQTKKFTSPEVMVKMKCDVHPWMEGYIGVLPHPYFAVSDSSGAFEIKNLPPGEYTIEAWHEKLGVQSQKVTIEPRGTKEIEFKFSA